MTTRGAGAIEISVVTVQRLPTETLERSLRVGTGDMVLKSLINTMLVQFPHPKIEDHEKALLTNIFMKHLRERPEWAVRKAFATFEATGKFRPQVSDIIDLATKEAALVGVELEKRRQRAELDKQPPARPPEAKRAVQALVGELFPQIVETAAQRRRETEADIAERETRRGQ